MPLKEEDDAKNLLMCQGLIGTALTVVGVVAVTQEKFKEIALQEAFYVGIACGATSVLLALLYLQSIKFCQNLGNTDKQKRDEHIRWTDFLKLLMSLTWGLCIGGVTANGIKCHQNDDLENPLRSLQIAILALCSVETFILIFNFGALDKYYIKIELRANQSVTNAVKPAPKPKSSDSASKTQPIPPKTQPAPPKTQPAPAAPGPSILPKPQDTSIPISELETRNRMLKEQIQLQKELNRIQNENLHARIPPHFNYMSPSQSTPNAPPPNYDSISLTKPDT